MYIRVARLALTVALIALLQLASGSGVTRLVLAAGPICTVNSAGGANYTTIQAAITDAGCTTINVAAGTYSEHLTIGRNLTLNGAGVASTIVDGGGTDRVLRIDSGTVNISGVTIRNGHPQPGDGGGISNSGALRLNNSAVINNTVDGDAISSYGWGAGIFTDGSLTIDNTAILSNTIANGSGGGIYSTGALTVTGSTLAGNYGYGIYSAGALKIDRSTIRENFGVGVNSLSGATLTNTTISRNNQINSYGGIGLSASASAPATVSLTNVTVSGNPNGGITNAVTMLITNTSVISNTSPTASSSGISNVGTLRPTNTLVAYNGSPNCTNSGTWISNGHNLSSDSTCGFTDPTDKPGVDPKAGALANNGGPTQTQALLPGSPAVDAGTNTGCTAADQRGVTRPIDGDQNGTATCDIGAYESQPQLAIFGISPTSAAAGGAGVTLTVTGTLFISGAKVEWNGVPLPTTFVNSRRLTAQVSASNILDGGFVPVRVVNPGNLASNVVMFAINSRIPALAGVAPGLVATGGPTFTLTLTGANFVRASRARWNDAPRPTTFVDAGHLKVQIGADDVALAQQANVTVENPAPGGGISNEASVDVGITYAGSIGGGVPTVAISGTLAYIGEGSEFTILNVSNPAAPVRLGGFTTREAVEDVEVVGSRAYITADHDGLLILDVSDPATPKLLGSYNTPWHAYDVQVVGNIAYVAAEYGGLQIIDVSDPAHPRLLGHYNMTAYDLSVVNNVVYIAAGNSYDPFMSLDVHDPAHPTLRDDYAGDPNFGVTTGVHVVGHLAYLASSDSLIIADVTTPSNGFPGPYYAYDFHDHVKDVYVIGNRAFVTSYAGKLYIMDVTDWQHPQLLSTYETHGSSWDVRVVGSRAYVADGVGGLLILNVSNPNSPAKLGKYATWSAYNQTIVGNRAYIAGGTTGLQILDVSVTAAPTRLGAFATSGFAADVEVVNNLAFVANKGIWNGSTYVGGGLQIVNISNPAAPALIGSYALEYAADVQVIDNRAYVAASNGLYILNVSNPAHLVLVGKFSTSSVPAFGGVQVVGNRAYTIAYIGVDIGIAILDVTNPISPTLLSSYIGLGNLTDLQVIGNFAYVTDRYSGFSVLDVHDPAHIDKLGGYGNDYTSAFAVHIVGSLAYVAESEQNAGDLAIVDVSNPANLKLVGERHLPWHALGVQVVGNLVYVAVEQDGLQILRLPISYRVFLPLARR